MISKNKVPFLLLNLTILTRVISTKTKDCVPKIAIIGGGIGGASTSHFLTKLFQNRLEIDLYEPNKIGGRLSTVYIDNNEYEAGGAIIHSKNQLMKYFAAILGLKERPLENDKLAGIWNGDEFVFTESRYELISLAKLLYRYGLQPLQLQRHVNSILDDFSKTYELLNDGGGFKNISSLLSAMNSDFPKMLQVSIADYLTKLGYSSMLINELVKAGLVVNYGQGTNVHSFVGLVSTAGTESTLWSIEGGNHQVPQNLILQNKIVRVQQSIVSGINYSTTTRGIPQYTLNVNTEEESKTYDIVIIAAPLTKDHEMQIEFNNFTTNVDFKFPGKYHLTYVTFVRGTIRPSYFGLNSTSIDMILSCDPDKTTISSIGRLNTVYGVDSDVWKIFSRKSVESDRLKNMFTKIDTVREIKWQAYPQYSSNTDSKINFELNRGLYHINAIEWAASAMEMSAIGGKNVAILAHNYYKDITSCKYNSKKEINTEL